MSRRSKQLSEGHKRRPGRCGGCLEATIGGPDVQKAPKIAAETPQRTPRRAYRAPGRSWRGLNNEKPQKHNGFSSLCEQRRRCPDAHKRLPGRSRGCLEATTSGLDPSETPKIASETTQRVPGRAFRASGRSWRPLNNEKPQKHYGFHHFRALEHKPVLARGREARLNVGALL